MVLVMPVFFFLNNRKKQQSKKSTTTTTTAAATIVIVRCPGRYLRLLLSKNHLHHRHKRISTQMSQVESITGHFFETGVFGAIKKSSWQDFFVSPLLKNPFFQIGVNEWLHRLEEAFGLSSQQPWVRISSLLIVVFSDFL